MISPRASANPSTCVPLTACSNEQPAFNWNHGDYQTDITKTWLGMAGPGVRHEGFTGAVFSDHTDVRPTLLALTGLADDYVHDGRVLFEVFDERAVPRAMRMHGETLSRLASAYKAINAPVGALGRITLELSTKGLVADDATYAAHEAKINELTTRRNEIASRMITLLEGAAFGNTPINEHEANELILEALILIASAE